MLLTGSNYEAFITALKHGLVDLAICDSEENVDVSVLLIEQDLDFNESEVTMNALCRGKPISLQDLKTVLPRFITV